MKKIGVFISGRLNSERLPNKLILPFGESTLWEIACRKLDKLPTKYQKYALCCDKELVEIALKYKNITVIIRDEDTALIDGPSKEIYRNLEVVDCDYLMALNPCCYMLKVETIISALGYFQQGNFDYMTSVKDFKSWLYHKKKLLTLVNKTNYSTKEVKDYYEAAHCFHVFNKDQFFIDSNMLKDGHATFQIEQEEALDVDTLLDYQIGTIYMERRLKCL